MNATLTVYIRCNK